MIITDQILGSANPYVDLYEPTRVKPIASIGRFIKENASFPAHIIADRFKSAEGSDPSEIGPGEGKILKIGGEKIACSRSADGVLHAVSPACTHMGCHVAWNHAERTWDCPCHGSRLKPTGEVVDGPAMTPLPTKALPPAKNGPRNCSSPLPLPATARRHQQVTSPSPWRRRASAFFCSTPTSAVPPSTRSSTSRRKSACRA